METNTFMRTCVAGLLALVAALPTAPSARETLRERWAARPARAASGQQAVTQAFTLTHDGLERHYLVHVPAGYSGQRPVPLLIALHGGGGSAALQAREDWYGLISSSDRRGHIVVFPNGVSPVRSGMLATWNAGACCGNARDGGVDDVGFVRAVVAQVQERWAIDPKRIYATGMSNGGMLAHRLACEMADVFAAVASVAGTDNTLTCRPARPISVLHIHARDDTHVLFDGGAGQDAFRDASKVTAFTSVAETVSRWMQRDGCPATPPRRVLEKPGAYCEAHEACAGGTRVQSCVTEDGGHSWPGGGAVRGKAPSRAMSANDVMWEFFDARP